LSNAKTVANIAEEQENRKKYFGFTDSGQKKCRPDFLSGILFVKCLFQNVVN